MTQEEKAIEIPFGAKDSELLEWVYFIPEGMEAEIKDRKVIIKKAESEDERIRRTLVEYFGPKVQLDFVRGIPIQKIRDWLEKQKEQKPVSQEDFDTAKHEALWGEQKPAEHSAKGRRGRIGTTPEHIRKKAENFLSKMEPPYDADDICTAYEAGALESAKPAEWSEEDEKMLARIIERGQSQIQMFETGLLPEHITWLKSLRPSWKPSEEEERLINTSISFLKDFADKGYENAVECIDWLKSKLNGNSGK